MKIRLGPTATTLSCLLFLCSGPAFAARPAAPSRDTTNPSSPRPGHDDWFRRIDQRLPCVMLQFDDGNVTHYTTAWPILQAHGFVGSFGIVTGNVGNAWSMSGAMLRELLLNGCSFQDHTRTHDAAEWGSPSYSQLWGPDILFSQAVFRDSVGVLPMRAWNQPGGTGEGWSTELGDTLRAYGYDYTAGAVSVTTGQWTNFHYGFSDDPFRLGRWVYSWGYNAPAADWTWQAEVGAIEDRLADGVAQGVLPQLVFHVVDGDVTAGLDSICTWIADQGLIPVTMDDAVAIARAPHDFDYGRNIAAPIDVDRNGDTRPDGWDIYEYIDMDGNADNGIGTTINGPPPGELVFSVAMSEPTLLYSDDFTLTYEKTMIDPVTFAYSTVTETRVHTIAPEETLSFADTLEIGVSEHVDRVKVSFSGVWKTPFKIQSFTAVPVLLPTAVTAKTPRAGLAVRVLPNPSGRGTTISIHMDRPTVASVEVFDVRGRRVAALVSGRLLNGDVRVPWNQENVASGIYFVRVSAGSIRAVRKISVIK